MKGSIMRMHVLFAVVLALVATPILADIPTPPPSSWKLAQNAPDPFCPSEHGATKIEFQAPRAAHGELVVLSHDGTTVLRTLFDGLLQAGYFSVLWDGKDSNGNVLGEDVYPYRLTATDPSNFVLFQETKSIALSCFLSIDSRTWSQIKSLYE